MRLSELYLIKSSEHLVKLNRKLSMRKVYIQLSMGPVERTIVLNAKFYHRHVRNFVNQKWVEANITKEEKFEIKKYTTDFYVHLN